MKLSVRGVGEYLARWGYTPQKAARRAYERDDEAVKLWLQREYPNCHPRKVGKGRDLLGRRDLAFAATRAGTAAMHRGQTPIIKIPARRKSLSLIAAVTNQGKVRFMIYAGGITPQRLILFMRRLTKDAKRKVFLILDNLNVHKVEAGQGLAGGRTQNGYQASPPPAAADQSQPVLQRRSKRCDPAQYPASRSRGAQTHDPQSLAPHPEIA